MTEDNDTKIDEVATILQKRIDQGLYVAGQRLPSERRLQDNLNVSRATIRGALSRLQIENIIDIIPRSGAIVRPSSTKVRVGSLTPAIAPSLELKRAGSFIRAMEVQGQQTLVRFIEPSSIVDAGEELARKMQTCVEMKLLRRYRVHLVNKVPYRILDSYYLADLLGDLLGKDEGYIPLFKWLREHKGVIAKKAFESISVRMPSQEEAELLNVSRTQPVIDMDRWVWSKENILFEYSHIIENAVLHEHTYSYEIEEEASK